MKEQLLFISVLMIPLFGVVALVIIDYLKKVMLRIPQEVWIQVESVE